MKLGGGVPPLARQFLHSIPQARLQPVISRRSMG
jgi:hypothetical protein